MFVLRAEWCLQLQRLYLRYVRWIAQSELWRMPNRHKHGKMGLRTVYRELKVTFIYMILKMSDFSLDIITLHPAFNLRADLPEPGMLLGRYFFAYRANMKHFPEDSGVKIRILATTRLTPLDFPRHLVAPACGIWLPAPE